MPYLMPAGEGPGHHTLPPATAGPGLLARSRSKQSKQTAATFVTYFAQRLSAACVMYGAESILGALKKARGARLQGGTS